MTDFFTVNELAEYFGGNPKTIYRKLWAKEIPAYKVGRTWRTARKDIMWWGGTGKKRGDKLLIVPPAFHDTLGSTGPIITISSLHKIHQGQD